MTYDAIIIGSGFGGAFAADHLVNAGMRVALVERGPWRDTAPVRAAGITQRSPLPHGVHALTHLVRRITSPLLPAGGLSPHAHGLFDLHLEGDMSVVASSGVGGGSHVYSAMNTRPAAEHYWDQRADGISDKTMAPYYGQALARMGARAPRHGEGIPNFTGDRFSGHALLHADKTLQQPEMGFRFERGAFRSNSYFGSADGSKVTLDELLVAPAMSKGLDVLDLHEAVDIGRSARGWRVTLRHQGTGGYRHLDAPRLLLAAGTLNTMRLLFAARARGNLAALPALGLGFSGNGDMLGYWACNDDGADYSLGTPCHGRFALRADGETPYLTSFGMNGIDDLPLPKILRARLRRDLILVAMGADEANGVARWRSGRLSLHYNRDANPVLARISATFRQIAQASGKPVRSLRRYPVTVHPLGGARVADDPALGVVNASGAVHGHPGLYIADASALPGAPGSPPSMSIAAWSLHVAHGITANT
ncbi:MAG: GMC oxidoreductase [bacterium]|nr:GMC oxidoreductase [bacterium]